MKPSLLSIPVCALLLAPMSVAQSSRYSRPPVNSSQSVGAITDIINRCEDRTDDFRKSLRRALNDSALDNSSREATLRRRADQLERALDRTGDSWNKDRDLDKTRRYVREALDAGRDINHTMRNWRLNYDVERDWQAIRSQLNALARAFRLSELR